MDMIKKGIKIIVSSIIILMTTYGYVLAYDYYKTQEPSHYYDPSGGGYQNQGGTLYGTGDNAGSNCFSGGGSLYFCSGGKKRYSSCQGSGNTIYCQ